MAEPRIKDGDIPRYLSRVADRAANYQGTGTLPDSAGTITIGPAPGAADTQMQSRFGAIPPRAEAGQAGRGPRWAQVDALDEAPAKKPAKAAPKLDKPVASSKVADSTKDSMVPVSGSAAPAGAPSAAPTSAPGGWMDTSSSLPESEYDSDVRVARMMARSLAGIGDNEGAMEYSKLYHDATAKRYADVAKNAISAFAATGDIMPAVAMYNHIIPNGKKIVRVGRVGREGDNLAFELSDGRTQMMTPSQFNQMLAQFQNPETLTKMFGDAAKAAGEGRAKMAELQYKAMSDVQMEQLKAGLKFSGEVQLEQYKQAKEAGKVKPIGKVGDEVAFEYGGQIYTVRGATMDANEVNMPASVSAIGSLGGQQAGTSLRTGSVTGR